MVGRLESADLSFAIVGRSESNHPLLRLLSDRNPTVPSFTIVSQSNYPRFAIVGWAQSNDPFSTIFGRSESNVLRSRIVGWSESHDHFSTIVVRRNPTIAFYYRWPIGIQRSIFCDRWPIGIEWSHFKMIGSSESTNFSFLPSLADHNTTIPFLRSLTDCIQFIKFWRANLNPTILFFLSLANGNLQRSSVYNGWPIGVQRHLFFDRWPIRIHRSLFNDRWLIVIQTSNFCHRWLIWIQLSLFALVRGSESNAPIICMGGRSEPIDPFLMSICRL